MKTLILMLVALSAFAQTSQDIAVLMSKRPGLARSGMAAGVQTGSANLVLHSADFSNAAWMKTNVTAASAVSIKETSATAAHLILQPVATPIGVVSYSVELKADGREYAAVYNEGSATGKYFNLSTGEILGNLNGAPLSASITSVGDGWYRCSIAINMAVATATSYSVYLSATGSGTSYTGDIAKGIFIRNAIVNPGSTALPYVATTDLQSIASILPGTATLVRGANTGASTDDPAVSLADWTFDSGDRVSGLPAKGAAWTTTNCSGVECYTLTSAGTEYVNGVARRNLLRWSEALGISGTPWSIVGWSLVSSNNAAPDGTNTASLIDVTASGANNVLQNITVIAGQVYTLSFYAKSGTLQAPKYSVYNTTTGSEVIASTSYAAQLNASTYTRVAVSFTAPVGCSAVNVYLMRDGTTTGTIYLWGAMVNLGSTALSYQKTTDSREWALGTPGNYVGLLTGFYRWDRILGPGEVNRNYFQYQRPQINAKGNSLP